MNHFQISLLRLGLREVKIKSETREKIEMSFLQKRLCENSLSVTLSRWTELAEVLTKCDRNFENFLILSGFVKLNLTINFLNQIFTQSRKQESRISFKVDYCLCGNENAIARMSFLKKIDFREKIKTNQDTFNQMKNINIQNSSKISSSIYDFN